MHEYIVIAGETHACDTSDEVAAAARALSAAGVNQATVWRTPHALDWIRENGDPDGVETSHVVLADTDADPVGNGTRSP